MLGLHVTVRNLHQHSQMSSVTLHPAARLTARSRLRSRDPTGPHVAFPKSLMPSFGNYKGLNSS